MIPRRASLVLLALLVLLTGFSAAPLQQDDSQYFPDSGHWVTGEFLAFYRSVPSADLLFGNPITEAFADTLREGIQVQYFEKVRLDYDPGQPAGQRVSIADLGTFLYSETLRGQPADFSTNTPMCRFFPETRKNVCYAFLQFYDRHNGPELFGQPISDAEYVNDRLVQYFERARMEWRIDRPVGQRVVLTEIGRIDFDRRIGNLDLLRPVSIPQYRLKELRVNAFVARPLVAPGEKQQVHVIVRNQYYEPLPDITVIATVTYPDGRVINERLAQLTDGDGLARYEFEVDQVEPNQVVQVTIEAEAPNGPSSTANTWFRTWW